MEVNSKHTALSDRSLILFTAFLLFSVTPPFQNDEENFKSYKVREGDGIALPCYDRPTFKPPGPFSWYYKFGDVQDQIPVRSTDRFDIDANGETEWVHSWRKGGGVKSWGGDVAPLVRASDRHPADAGSIPRCGRGFFSQGSTFSADFLTCVRAPPPPPPPSVRNRMYLLPCAR